MHRHTSNEGARRGVALLWVASMVFSGLIGTLLLGFDASTVLKWCALAALPPLLVLFFVRGTAVERPRRRIIRPDPRWESTEAGPVGRSSS